MIYQYSIPDLVISNLACLKVSLYILGWEGECCSTDRKLSLLFLFVLKLAQHNKTNYTGISTVEHIEIYSKHLFSVKYINYGNIIII